MLIISYFAIDYYLLEIQGGCDLFEPIKTENAPLTFFQIKHSQAMRVWGFLGLFTLTHNAIHRRGTCGWCYGFERDFGAI
jgi:hypothetical protein